MPSLLPQPSRTRTAIARFVRFDGASALGVGSLTAWAGASLPPMARFATTLLTVAGTLFIYNLDHLRDDRHPDARVRLFLLVLSVSLGGAALAILPVDVLGACLVPGFLGVLHRPLKRRLPAAKSFSVALAVSVACIGIPAAASGTPADTTSALFLFVLVALNAHASDLLDLDGDAAAGLQTLPVRLGVEATHRLFTTAAAVTALCLLYVTPLNPRPETALSLVVMTLLLRAVRPDRRRTTWRLALESALAAPLLLGSLF